MKKTIRIISHMRAGTHFLRSTILSNFNVPVKKVKIGTHEKTWKFVSNTNTYPKIIGKDKLPIYILRDCRDILVSEFKWTPHKLMPNDRARFKKKNFSQFIRGNFVLKKHKHRIMIEFLKDPIQYWIDHTEWIEKEDLLLIKYEDLKYNFKPTIKKIKNYIGVPFVSNGPKPLDKLVGGKPFKGKSGTWKQFFSEKDLDYFWSKAGETMEKYGYKR